MINNRDSNDLVKKVLAEAERDNNSRGEVARRMVTEVTPAQANKLMAAVRDRTRHLIGGVQDTTSVREVEHSNENQKLLNDPKRKKEYQARIETLSHEERSGCPSFNKLMEQLQVKSDETLDELRARAKDLRFVVAVIRDGQNKIISYRPGLIEALAEPDFLRDTENPKNLPGAHYDKVYGDLSPHGLRLPEWPEYKALFAMIKRMDSVSIDTRGWVLLNMGPRTDKSALVSLAREALKQPTHTSDSPDNPNANLISRPSTWGGDVLPKTA